MRRHQYRSSWASLFASKRIVVALCAAIAMVLGAMSVGAYTPKPAGPVEEFPLQAANQATIVSEDVGTPQQPSQQLNVDFAKRRQSSPLSVKEDEAAQEQLSANTDQLPGLNLSVGLGPVEVEANIVISPQTPLLGDETAVIPVIPSEQTPVQPEEQLQGNTPAPEDALTTFVNTENPSGTVIQ